MHVFDIPSSNNSHTLTVSKVIGDNKFQFFSYMMHPIFGYGSLCDLSSLKEHDNIYRNVSTDVKMAKLKGYKIFLNKMASGGKFGHANIIKTNKYDYVYGIIIYLTDSELVKIDKRENCYRRVQVIVDTIDGSLLQVETYIAFKECQSYYDLPITESYNTRLQAGLNYMRKNNANGFYDIKYFDIYSKYYHTYAEKMKNSL